MADLHIANTVSDLIQGDVGEHLPLERIPLDGDVLGLGTTSSFDNGELTFLQEEAAGITHLYKSLPVNGGLQRLIPGDGLQHFPYVCFTDDATRLRRPVPADLLGPEGGQGLQERIGHAIEVLRARGALEEAPIYGLRLESRWRSLVITVASKLCMGQVRRNDALARVVHSGGGGPAVGATIYERLPHFRLAPEDPGDPTDPVRYLGASLTWDGCGFWDTEPEQGRVTVPVPGAHLHLHGCSTDLRHGGHLHHEHPGSVLAELGRLVLYPLRRLHSLGADLAVRDLAFTGGSLRFEVANQGSLDASDVGVAVVIDDSYRSHRWLRLPWLAAGEAETFTMPLDLGSGDHELRVIVDPEHTILEARGLGQNNARTLRVRVP